MPKPMVDITGQRYGRLVVIGQTFDSIPKSGQRKRNWLTRCDCGQTKAVQGVTLANGNTRSCGCLRTEALRARRVDVPGYVPMHQRIYRERGKAAAYTCVDCADPAQEWSYDHLDPDEVQGTTPSGVSVVYSIDAAHYVPRCVPCHRSIDQQRNENRLWA